jgi:hypothetical protein
MFCVSGENPSAHSLRHVIAIDMAHCKAPHSCGVVALCVAYDANDNIHIIAFAHLPTEDGAQWTWFMTHVKDAFPKMSSSPQLCTISDQDKVRESSVFPVRFSFISSSTIAFAML